MRVHSGSLRLRVLPISLSVDLGVENLIQQISRSFVQIKAGLMPSILGMLVVITAINTYGYVYFNLGQVPVWASRRPSKTLG